MAKFVYTFTTEDPMEAMDIAARLGIKLNLAHTADGAFPSGQGLAPAAPAAPPAAPAYAPAPAVAAPPTPPAAPAAPAAPAPHDAQDQAILAGGWSMDTHIKPLGAQFVQKKGATGPAEIQALIAPYGATRLSAVSPKHWPALHATLTAAVA